MLDEGVVLLGCTLGEWLEPVSIVCHAIFNSPLLDARCNGVSHAAVEASSIVYNVNKLFINVLWQILVHLLTIEDIFAKILVGTFFGGLYGEGSFLKCLLYNLKS